MVEGVFWVAGCRLRVDKLGFGVYPVKLPLRTVLLVRESRI